MTWIKQDAFIHFIPKPSHSKKKLRYFILLQKHSWSIIISRKKKILSRFKRKGKYQSWTESNRKEYINSNKRSFSICGNILFNEHGIYSNSRIHDTIRTIVLLNAYTHYWSRQSLRRKYRSYHRLMLKNGNWFSTWTFPFSLNYLLVSTQAIWSNLVLVSNSFPITAFASEPIINWMEALEQITCEQSIWMEEKQVEIVNK